MYRIILFDEDEGDSATEALDPYFPFKDVVTLNSLHALVSKK
jgi:hypothetical protein